MGLGNPEEEGVLQRLGGTYGLRSSFQNEEAFSKSLDILVGSGSATSCRDSSCSCPMNYS